MKLYIVSSFPMVFSFRFFRNSVKMLSCPGCFFLFRNLTTSFNSSRVNFLMNISSRCNIFLISCLKNFFHFVSLFIFFIQCVLCCKGSVETGVSYWCLITLYCLQLLSVLWLLETCCSVCSWIDMLCFVRVYSVVWFNRNELIAVFLACVISRWSFAASLLYWIISAWF